MSRGIGALEKGLQVLAVLGEAEGPLGLSEIAAGAAMAPAMAHRYVASLVNAGMVARAEGAGRYDLGPAALRLGLRAMARLDGLDLAREAAADWNAQTGESVLLAVWFDGAPVVVDWHASHRAVSVFVRVGARLDPWRSATGRAFLAASPALRATVHASAERGLTWEGRAVRAGGIDALLETAGRRGLGRSLGDLMPGIDALAVPVGGRDAPDAGGAPAPMRYVLTTLGPHGALDVRLDGPLALSLKACATALARRLAR